MELSQKTITFPRFLFFKPVIKNKDDTENIEKLITSQNNLVFKKKKNSGQMETFY